MTAEQIYRNKIGMTQEERELQHSKVDWLRYIACLLERIAYQAAPGSRELDDWRQAVREADKCPL